MRHVSGYPKIAGLRRTLTLAALLGLPVAAQSPGAPSMLSQTSRAPFADSAPDNSPDRSMEAKRIRLLNVQRQKTMVSDAEKLLALARELDADARAETSTLSPVERMHKAAEIEKLARDVREKMTFAVTLPSEPVPPYSVWQP